VVRWGALPAVRSSADWPAAAAARLSAPWSERVLAHSLPVTDGAATDVIIGITAIAIITAVAADGTASRTAIAAELAARKFIDARCAWDSLRDWTKAKRDVAHIFAGNI
jgi:hypothetical protein